MFYLLKLLSYIIILIVPVDAHTCESATVIKHRNIKIIRLDEQQSHVLKNITDKNNVFCEARI